MYLYVYYLITYCTCILIVFISYCDIFGYNKLFIIYPSDFLQISAGSSSKLGW